MSIDAKPGSTLHVTVTADPTNEAAAKTLSRVFAKDPIHRKTRVFRKKLRTLHMEGRHRGGRIWMVRPKAPRLVQPKKGDGCHLFATSALIRDLNSVARFVEVKAEG
ncbi:MAG: hypothetical protein ACE5EQ_10495 [Phycisphaerae bacterium]